MTTSAIRTIAALRSEYDLLAGTVPSLSADQLTGPSGATEWTIADVLSHLGSGAEITHAGLRAALGEAEAPGPDFNQGIWDRWNALSPQDQALGSLAANDALITALETIPADRHDDLKFNVGFLPEPLSLASFAGIRLSETAPHVWDVLVGVDPAAGLSEQSAQLLAEHLSGGISILLGFIGKPDAVSAPAVVEISKTPYRIVLADKAALTTDATPATATFDGPLEAAVRLLYGRLTPQHTPAGLAVSGNVTLDELRAAFPGF
ncbi:maleylpyruvate isomerase N-terminal domain-containing protein [Actinoplanes awajinensis]|uniref:Mycothiol-dependent maleylpyruvate isomerase metal-binding domain-containing protein n=1 Tax=Actinoplanes awajinensis subsp. mycoplanecinus TaxID=135947 RepID=A0A124G9D4_9ACTN|nr:maleylpyruvate isomerase N-terminal domain-containing protein [Actinoplanes awajinensis]KUL28747.1 hypothetical protein ADL15_30840 [Actinoplanes awajinensis subsp. mycoplanecinus]